MSADIIFILQVLPPYPMPTHKAKNMRGGVPNLWEVRFWNFQKCCFASLHVRCNRYLQWKTLVLLFVYMIVSRNSNCHNLNDVCWLQRCLVGYEEYKQPEWLQDPLVLKDAFSDLPPVSTLAHLCIVVLVVVLGLNLYWLDCYLNQVTNFQNKDDIPYEDEPHTTFQHFIRLPKRGRSWLEDMQFFFDMNLSLRLQVVNFRLPCP